MSVSDIFDEFDKLHKAAVDARTRSAADKQERHSLVVSLMANVVKPFADDLITQGKLRNFTVAVEDRGADKHRPSYTIQFTSYENGRSIIGAGPSLKLTASEDCSRIEVAEDLGDLEESFGGKGPYNVLVGQPTTMSDMTKALEGWLLATVRLIVNRK